MTPSWANSQPWRVYIATGETLKQIQKAHLAFAQQGIRGNADFSTMHSEDWDIKSRRNMEQLGKKFNNF
ncbi:nitroreductase family protein [Metabacillus idriensis]|uniref:nitroreductase family protein n=1 Tax=Metabacillus idriensis TaxID=324768 RepID=UPI002812F13C|nr:nitroreductase family protein [Metabacillus idriensis]MDR0137831.1 nitroreductase family protein [Metabacillus idriensis]